MRIPTWMYDNWFECLLKAVKEFDSHFLPETEAAWENVLGKASTHEETRPLILAGTCCFHRRGR